MTRLLFIYPILAKQNQTFRYAPTARRLFNEKVDVRILTIGKKKSLPLELEGIPHRHIEANLNRLAGRWQISVQRKLWKYLKSLPTDNLTVFMNGLDIPVAFWYSKQHEVPLIAQFPEGECYSNIYKRLVSQLGKSPKISFLYGSQVHADSCKIEGFSQHVISMPLQPSLVNAAQQFRALQPVQAVKPFSVLIGCRSASPEVIYNIRSLVKECENLHFHCWFFNSNHLHLAIHKLRDLPHVEYSVAQEGIPLYKNSQLYIEVEEPQFTEPHLQHLHYIREAMAFGLPAMLFQQGLGQEWIKQGVNGYLLETGQLGEMTNKIKLLAHSTLLYDRLSYNAFKIAQQWHPPNTCRALANLFLGGKMKCTYKTGLRPVDNATT